MQGFEVLPVTSLTLQVTGSKVLLYLRVSTSKQDTENQRRELEAVAARSGWQVIHVYKDAGISGAKGRDKRPDFDADVPVLAGFKKAMGFVF